MRCNCDVVLISVGSPIIIGIYQEKAYFDDDAWDSVSFKKVHNINAGESGKILTYHAQKGGKTSDVLPLLFNDILQHYNIKHIFYANGPGNFSALKLTHIFLHTLAFINDIELFCIDSFYFTKDKFINAYGKIHFYKDKGVIKTTMLNDKKDTIFMLPNTLEDMAMFSSDCTPMYILPAL